MFEEHLQRADRLPIFSLPAPADIDLSATNLGIDRPSSNKAARNWERQRPTSFYLAGEEDASNRNGYCSASAPLRAKMDSATSQTTKRNLLHHLEQLAGGPDQLISQLSDKVQDAPLVTSVRDLGKLVDSGWRPGSSWIRLAVHE